MKLFAAKFYQTLILNVATIAAIAVGIVQFLVRAYKENNGAEKTRKVMQTVLQFIDKIVEQLQAQLNTDVPVVKVAQKTTKRRWNLIYYIHTWEIHPMTQTQFDELYTKLYDAYESSMLKDEYVRSTLGDALDHMILMRSKGLVTVWQVAQRGLQTTPIPDILHSYQTKPKWLNSKPSWLAKTPTVSITNRLCILLREQQTSGVVIC